MQRIEAIPGVVGIQEGGHDTPPAIRFGDTVVEFTDPRWAGVIGLALMEWALSRGTGGVDHR